jgi:predicted enzyme related to lactoylglutathione lyase
LSFEVDDLDAAYARLKERGVEFSQPPKRESWGASAIFKDPDGNSFVLGER